MCPTHIGCVMHTRPAYNQNMNECIPPEIGMLRFTFWTTAFCASLLNSSRLPTFMCFFRRSAIPSSVCTVLPLDSCCVVENKVGAAEEPGLEEPIIPSLLK